MAKRKDKSGPAPKHYCEAGHEHTSKYAAKHCHKCKAEETTTDNKRATA